MKIENGIAILDNDAMSLFVIKKIVKRLMPSEKIIWTTTDAYKAIDYCLNNVTCPSILLCDMSLSNISGPYVCKLLREKNQDPTILAITSFPLANYASLAAQAGCQGIIEKANLASELGLAFKSLLEENVYCPKDINVKFESSINSHFRLSQKSKHKVEILTSREIEVMNRLLDGYSLKEIAEILEVSDVTVRTHVSHIKQKLNAKNLSQASIIWYKMKEEL